MNRQTKHTKTQAIVTFDLTLIKVFSFDFRLGQNSPTTLDTGAEIPYHNVSSKIFIGEGGTLSPIYRPVDTSVKTRY
jgi:hypothetical protein